MKTLITLITIVFTVGSVSQDAGKVYRTQLTDVAIKEAHPKVTLFATEELGLLVSGELETELIHGKWHYSQIFTGRRANDASKQLKVSYLISSKDETLYSYRCYILGDSQSVNAFFSAYWDNAATKGDGSKVGYHLEEKALLQVSKDKKVASILVTSTHTK